MLQLWMSINLKHLTKHNTHSGDATLVKHALLGKRAEVTWRLCNNIFNEMYVKFPFPTMSWFYHECSWVVCLLTITLKPSSLYSHHQYNYSTRQGFVWIFLSDRGTYIGNPAPQPDSTLSSPYNLMFLTTAVQISLLIKLTFNTG